MTKPLYCPNCGVPFPAGAHAVQPFVSNDTGETSGVYVCCCWACKWSGHILPDDEAPSD